MKIYFIGVGEAFDENLFNTSILVKTNINLLLDCGYAIPPLIWKHNPDQSFLDAIYISHLHSDHYFGLAALMKRMVEEKRRKKLTLICQEKDKQTLVDVSTLGHRGIFDNRFFPITLIGVRQERNITLGKMELSFAQTKHSVSNLAIRIKYKDKVVCYSGDGDITLESRKLFRGTDLLIHEGYIFDAPTSLHTTMKKVVEMAIDNSIKTIAFTHVYRLERKKKISKLLAGLSKGKIKILIPKNGEYLEL